MEKEVDFHQGADSDVEMSRGRRDGGRDSRSNGAGPSLTGHTVGSGSMERKGESLGLGGGGPQIKARWMSDTLQDLVRGGGFCGENRSSARGAGRGAGWKNVSVEDEEPVNKQER